MSQKDKIKKIFRKQGQRILVFFGLSFLLFLFPAPNAYFKSGVKSEERLFSDNVDLPKPPPIPVNITAESIPDITAEGVYIIDLTSNITLYQKNAKIKFKPASTTKIVTGLVALDHYQLDDVLTVKNVDLAERSMKLVLGEKLTAETLLYGTLVHSANDAALALADNYPDGKEKFVEAMNKKTASLNLENTHFTNPVGFDSEENYTTPSDLAKLAKYALNNKIFSKIVGTKSITVSDVTYTYFHELRNVNELLGKVAGVAGVKTGFTENAGEILVSEVKKNDRSILIVLLKSKDRFGETKRLIDWVFNNFSWKDIKEVIPANH